MPSFLSCFTFATAGLAAFSLVIPEPEILQLPLSSNIIQNEQMSALYTEALADNYIVLLNTEIDRQKTLAHFRVVESLVNIHNEILAQQSDNQIKTANSLQGSQLILEASNESFEADGSHHQANLNRFGIQKIWSLANIEVGYSVKLPLSAISILSACPEVLIVEPDSMVYKSDTPASIIDEDDVSTQTNAGWGMARLAQRHQLKPIRNINKFVHNNMDGKGINGYILDTGIYIDHSEFDSGRAKWGKTFVSTIPDEKHSHQDLHGHGTHVAGIFGGKTYGIAKKANIIAVKILDRYGVGVVSDIISGIEWATEQHINDSLHNDGTYKGAIINLSLGLGKLSPALNRIIELCSHFDINIAVASGNRNNDACLDSPASSPYAITVSATTGKDFIAPFSNYGSCVDIFAPGVDIPSSYNSGPYSIVSGSGTSCSSPAIAGLIAYLLSLSPGVESEFSSTGQIMKPAEVKSRLIKFATKDVLFGLPAGTINLIGYTGGGYGWMDFYH